jgi:hypothetical protein
MDSSTNRDSAPTLEVGAIGVVDSRGHFLEHTAITPQKPRTLQTKNEEPAVIVRTERTFISSEPSHKSLEALESSRKTTAGMSGDSLDKPTTMKLNFEEITTARKAPRRVNGLILLGDSSAVETSRMTLVVFLIGITLLLLALRLYFR